MTRLSPGDYVAETVARRQTTRSVVLSYEYDPPYFGRRERLLEDALRKIVALMPGPGGVGQIARDALRDTKMSDKQMTVSRGPADTLDDRLDRWVSIARHRGYGTGTMTESDWASLESVLLAARHRLAGRPAEFSIVLAALRIGLGNIGDERRGPFRHQVERIERHLNDIGDQDQARRLRALLDPPPDPYPDAKVVQS